jgi:GNAT superfamily N-acetyltransferase
MMIAEIRQCPPFAPVVIDRIWNAWWRPKGHDVSVIGSLLEKNLASKAAQPFCLVAYDGDTFIGTVSCIASDVAERPLLAPWIAALWVDPAFRRTGAASALLSKGAGRAFALGEQRLYLHCRTALQPFYEKRGWTLFERNAPVAGMHILSLTLP